jgi:adenine-specific DNA-methyltransferase
MPVDIKRNIDSNIKAFGNGDLSKNAINLFKALGYNTERQTSLDKPTYECFKESFLDHDSRFNKDKALASHWKYINLLFQISKEELSGQLSLMSTGKYDDAIIESFLFFVVELNSDSYIRSDLSGITREINKCFPMPVIVLFKYNELLTLAVIDRKTHKRDESKDVLKKVILIRDISIESPHRAHIEILFDLSFSKLLESNTITNFVELYNAWQKTLDTKELNKRFYRDLSNWYFWAMKEVIFPDAPFQAGFGADPLKDPQVREHNAKNLIRLLTRLLFVWFIKEKKLIPEEFFDERYLSSTLLNKFEPNKSYSGPQKSIYYRAILQNLFFATLNQSMGKREFRKPGQHMNVTNLMRYESSFKNPSLFISLVEKTVPFMNGGLFECLDAPIPGKKGKLGGDVINYVDGFSDRSDIKLLVPDYIFFGAKKTVDLSDDYGDKSKSSKNAQVEGIINILKSYKFTVTENTPIEEEIALDPELLGKVFENLLASFNPETRTTARKQTGSFYTPREIVDYMVNESLKAYLKQKLEDNAGIKSENTEAKLVSLIGYNDIDNPFDVNETAVLITAIDTCKILDPACGSGAFPMGILHKLVQILHKTDPNNKLWREVQRQKAIKETEEAFKIGDKEERESRLKDISDVFEYNSDDYGRKLYLIENCIYGVDIQPIATQISKLRFFISLIVDQKADKSKDNFGVRALPNLETNFVAANTLIGVEKPKKQRSLFEKDEVTKLEKDLKEVRRRLFSAKTPPTKKKLRDKDKIIREKMGELLIDSGFEHKAAIQLASWDPYNQNTSSPFFEPEWMFGISDGFNVVIGNPPYIGQKGNNKIFMPVKKSSLGNSFHQRRMDYFYFFFHQALNLASHNGIIIFITTNYYITATYADLLRKDFKDRASLRQLINFNEFKIFESAAGQHNLITLILKRNDNHPVKVINTHKSGFVDSTILNNILSGIDEDTIYFEMPNQNIYEGNLNYIRLQNETSSGSGIDSLLEIVKNAGKPLGEICHITAGIQTGCDKLSQSQISKYGVEGNVGDGIFALSNDEIEELGLNQSEEIYLKPWFKNSDVSKWITNESSDESLIYYTSKTEKKISTNLLNHFEKYKPILINRNTRSGTPIITSSVYDRYVKGDYKISYVMVASAFQRGEYYCVSYARDIEYFEQPKIVAPQRSLRNTFGYNEISWYASADVYFIIQKDTNVHLKYILALLNSKLFYSWFYHKGKRKGESLELYLVPLTETPIKIVDAKTQAHFEAITDKIILGKKKNEDTGDLEKQIDEMVYKLYNLTDEEIAIIEGNSHGK